MYTGKKIQRRILIHFRRVLALQIVFSFLFYSYVSANASCPCCTGIDNKNKSVKKIESCCSSNTGEKKHHTCPDTDAENSAQDWSGCNKSCDAPGHLTCRDNNYRVEIIPIHELHTQNLLAKYILTSNSFPGANTGKQNGYFSSLNELYSKLCKIPLTIPLRI